MVLLIQCLESVRLAIAARVCADDLLVKVLRLVHVVAAVVDLGADELLVAMRAPELLKPGEHLPENIIPGDLFLAQELDEFVDVPEFVPLMFLDDASVGIDVDVGLAANHPLPLVVGEQRVAVDAVVEHVVLLFKQVFQLLHEQLRRQLVFLVLQVVQLVERDLAGQPFH